MSWEKQKDVPETSLVKEADSRALVFESRQFTVSLT